jgi:symplekin
VADEAMIFTDIDLPAPEPLNPLEKDSVVADLVERMWSSGSELAGLPEIPSDGLKAVVQPKDIWMLLLARMSTRSPETRRKAIADFVAADFAVR